MKTIVIRVVINAIALWVASLALSGISISGETGTSGIMGRIGTMLVLGALFGIINALIKPFLKLIAAPLILVTLGLFTFIINAFMLWLLSWIAGQTSLTFDVDKFWPTAVIGSLIISFVSFVLNTLVPDDD